jgi:hypothetical protein
MWEIFVQWDFERTGTEAQAAGVWRPSEKTKIGSQWTNISIDQIIGAGGGFF